MADMGMSGGATPGADRGTLRPEADRPGHVAPMSEMNMGAAPAPAAMAVAPMAGMDHCKMAMPNMGHAQMAMPGMNHGAIGGMRMADPIQQDTGTPRAPRCCRIATSRH